MKSHLTPVAFPHSLVEGTFANDNDVDDKSTVSCSSSYSDESEDSDEMVSDDDQANQVILAEAARLLMQRGAHAVAMPKNSSDSDLLALIGGRNQGIQRMMRRGSTGGTGVIHVIQTSSAQKPQDISVEHPKDVLATILATNGVAISTRKFDTLPDFFLTVTDEHIADYNMDLVAAVRQNDFEKLRAQHEAGKRLQCCNRFGESIVHMAFRRGCLEIVQYLLLDANVSVRVVCDSGRNPLHDACWTASPNFDCIRLLLQECPDLLYIEDKRGFVPLNYVPKDAWSAWNEFLADNSELLVQPQSFV